MDLFSLRMNLETTGTAQATSGLQAVESAGQRTAASLGGLNAANGQVRLGYMAQDSAARVLAASQENLRNSVFRVQKDVSGATAAFKAGKIGTDDYRTAIQTANTHLLGLGNTTDLSKRQLAAYHATLRQSAQGLKELEAGAAANVSTFDRMAGAASKFLLGFFAAKAVVGFLVDSALAAADADRANTKLQVSVQATGLSWAKYKDEVMGVANATQQNTIFTDEAAKDALAKLLLVTRDVTEAKRLLGIATDLATFKQIGLVQATDTLVRVQAGYTRVVREFGITTKDGTEAVNQLAALLSGQASAGAATFAGRLKQITNQWSEFKETLGNFLIASGLPEFLANSNRELNTMIGLLNRFNGTSGGLKTSERDPADLQAELKQLRAARASIPATLPSNNPFSSETVANPALAANMQRQLELQAELVRREQQRILSSQLAANKQHDADEEHIKLLADGFKLGTLTTAENAERLRIAKQLRADMAGANLEERNHLKELIDSLLPKAETAAGRLARLLNMPGFQGDRFATAPDDLGSPFGAPKPLALKGGGGNDIGNLVAPMARGRGGEVGENDPGYMQGATFMDRMRQGLVSGLRGLTPFRDQLAGFFQNIFATGKIGVSLKNFGREILAGMGSIFAQMAAKAILAAPLFQAIGAAMRNPFTAGFALLAFGIALSALGASMGGAAQGTGGGGDGGIRGRSEDQITRITLTADGAGGFQAPQAQHGPVIKVLGVHSPEGQRVFGEYRDKAARRGV